MRYRLQTFAGTYGIFDNHAQDTVAADLTLFGAVRMIWHMHRKPASIADLKTEYARITRLNVLLAANGIPANHTATRRALWIERELKRIGGTETTVQRLARTVYQDSGASMPEHLTRAY